MATWTVSPEDFLKQQPAAQPTAQPKWAVSPEDFLSEQAPSQPSPDIKFGGLPIRPGASIPGSVSALSTPAQQPVPAQAPPPPNQPPVQIHGMEQLGGTPPGPHPAPLPPALDVNTPRPMVGRNPRTGQPEYGYPGTGDPMADILAGTKRVVTAPAIPAIPISKEDMETSVPIGTTGLTAKVGTIKTIANTITGQTNVETLATLLAAEFGGQALKAIANSPKVVKLLADTAPGVQKAVDIAANAAVPGAFGVQQTVSAGSAGKQAYDLYQAGKPAEAEQAAVQAITSLAMAAASMAGATRAARATAATYPPAVAPEATASAAKVGGIASPPVAPGTAAAVADALESKGANLAAQAWKKLDTTRATKISVRGEPVYLSEAGKVPGTKHYYQFIFDKDGNTLVGGTPETVRAWLVQAQVPIDVKAPAYPLGGQFGPYTEGTAVAPPRSLEPVIRQSLSDVTIEPGSQFETPQGTVTVRSHANGKVGYDITMPDGQKLENLPPLPLARFQKLITPKSAEPAAQPFAVPPEEFLQQPEAQPPAPAAAAPVPPQPEQAPVPPPQTSSSAPLQPEPSEPAQPVPAVSSEMGSRIDKMKLPDYVKDTLREDVRQAEQMGIVQQIEDLSAQRLTAKEVVNRLQIPGDIIDSNRIVRSVRAVLGIPSMDSKTEFENWLKSRQPAPVEAPPPLSEEVIQASSAVPETAGTTEKQPWEMTRDEYIASQPGFHAATRQSKIHWGMMHEAEVADAIIAGRPVPANVRAEYPDMVLPESTPQPLEAGPQGSVRQEVFANKLYSLKYSQLNEWQKRQVDHNIAWEDEGPGPWRVGPYTIERHKGKIDRESGSTEPFFVYAVLDAHGKQLGQTSGTFADAQKFALSPYAIEKTPNGYVVSGWGDLGESARYPSKEEAAAARDKLNQKFAEASAAAGSMGGHFYTKGWTGTVDPQVFKPAQIGTYRPAIDAMADAFRSGNPAIAERPIAAVPDGRGGIDIVEGSHRAAAAQEAGVRPRVVIVADSRSELEGMNAPQVDELAREMWNQAHTTQRAEQRNAAPTPEGGLKPAAAEESSPAAPSNEVAKPVAAPASHSYASTQVNIPQQFAQKSLAFAKSIPADRLTKDGIEETPHITLRYGNAEVAPDRIAAALAGQGPITAKVKGLSIFPDVDTEHGKADVLKLDIDSPDLRKLNALVGKAVPHPGETHPDYKPHLTIAYLKPGEGRRYAGRSIPGLSGQTITFNSVMFSPAKGEMTEIPLGTKQGAKVVPIKPAEPPAPTAEEIGQKLVPGVRRTAMESQGKGVEQPQPPANVLEPPKKEPAPVLQMPAKGTPASGEDVIRGSINIPLSPMGEQQAAELGKQISDKGGLDRLTSSDLVRTEQTADAIAGQINQTRQPLENHLAVLMTPNLHPMHMGEIEGQPTKQVLDRMNEFITKHPDTPIPGKGEGSTAEGESFKSFMNRTIDYMHDEMAAWAQHPEPRPKWGYVTHFRVARLLESWADHGFKEVDPHDLTTKSEKNKPGSVHRIYLDGDQWKMQPVDMADSKPLEPGIYIIRHGVTAFNGENQPAADEAPKPAAPAEAPRVPQETPKQGEPTVTKPEVTISEGTKVSPEAVSMKPKEFEEEHERLPEVLRNGTPEERNAEADKQAKELEEVKQAQEELKQPEKGPKVQQILSPGAWADSFETGDRISFTSFGKRVNATVVRRDGDQLRVDVDGGLTQLITGTDARQRDVERLPKESRPSADKQPEKPDLQAQIDQHMQKAQALVDQARKEKSLKRAKLLAEAQKEAEKAADLRDQLNAQPKEAPVEKPEEKPTIETEKPGEPGAPARTAETRPRSPEGEGPLAETPTENVRPTPEGGETGSVGAVSNQPDEGVPSPTGAEGEGLQPSAGTEPATRVPSGRRGRPRTPEQYEPSTSHDYRITPEDHLGEGTEKVKAKNNLEAIRTLKKIQEEGREATPEEQAKLVKYVGWGQLSAIFDPWAREWAGFQEELKDLVGHDEYEKARASTKNAHYTSPLVVGKHWEALKRLGVRTPDFDFLETSMGIGHYFGLMPEDLIPARRTGVELDPLTGGIAKLLYPSANIQIMGFEKAALPNNYFDVAASNVPFGKYGVHDPKYKRTPFVTASIHNYFFAKALDKVRPGGIVSFITSSFTLDAKSPQMRKYLADRADFLGAIRLPGGKKGAFAKNAGTEVTTDIIFLQKREPQAPAAGEKWTDLAEVDGLDENGKPIKIEVNEYYAKHPEMMLGQMALQGTMYGPEKSKVLLGDLTPEALDAAIAKLPENVYTEYKEESKAFEGNPIHELPNPGEIKDGGFGLKDGQIIVRNGDRYSTADLSAPAAERVKGMMEVRGAVRNVFRTQLSDASDAEIEAARKTLNRVYDAFVKKHGPLNSKENIKAFFGDPDAPLLSSLEDYDEDKNTAKKRPIFRERVIDRYRPVEKVDKGSDALAVSLAETGRIDWMRMQELTGRTPDELQTELSQDGLIFRNPDGQKWETADEYLSGNVRAKLEVAENAAKTNSLYRPNVDALKAAQPKDLTPAQINANLGASWLPVDDVREFLAHLLFPNVEGWARKDYLDTIQVGHAGVLGNWTVRVGDRVESLASNTDKWGYGSISGHELVEKALNLQNPVIKMAVPTDDGKGTKLVINKKATLAAQEKQDAIKKEFKKWLWSDQERATRLSRKYNDEFNNLRLREYSGAHLTFPGMARLGLRNHDLDAHQKNAVWRIIQNGNTLLGHAVGAGKTFEMIAAAMELKRMGLIRKPMFVVPNHLVEQWGGDFLRLYPGANVFVAGKEHFSTGRRQAAMSRIATGNYDAVIVAHRSFQFLPVSDETFNGFMQEQLHDINQALKEAEAQAKEDEARESGSYSRRRKKPKKSPTVKQLEAAKARIEKQIEDRAKRESADKTITFEEMGVDHLFVDEAHAFKNLYFPTKMNRVAGLPNSQSDRAMDMFIKSQYLTRLNNGRRGVVFATGTPVMNSLAELFTMQRYLQLELLKETGVQAFDSWAQNFTQPISGLELAPEGENYRINTRLNFANLPELLTAFRSVADIKTAADLNLPKPKLKTGKAIVISVKATPELKEFVKHLGERAEAIRSGHVRPDVDNMLKVVGAGRHAALDIRLVRPGLPDNPASKVNVAVHKIHEIWKETKAQRSTQTVFLDLSTPRGTRDTPKKTKGGEEEPEVQGAQPSEETKEALSVYDDIRRKLIKLGIPSNEIKFIHDAKDDAAKQRLFNDMNSGRVRILMGSTEKMGAGMNAQQKMIALHHLDAPWRPGDIEQRNGRIERQGNENPEVQIYQYVTEGSFDAYMWQTLMNKANMVANAMKGDLSIREIEDVGMMQMTAAEAMAAASGNPEVRERIGVEMEVRKLEALKEAHEDAKRTVKWEIGSLPQKIKALHHDQSEFSKAIKIRDDYPKDQDPWKIYSKGFVPKDAADRNKKLLELAMQMAGSREDMEIGEYKDFTIRAVGRGTMTYTEGKKQVETPNLPEITVGKLSTYYDLRAEDPKKDPGLHMASAIRYIIDNQLDKRLTEISADLEKSEKRYQDLQGELDTPFEHEDRLLQLQARLKELNDKLDIGKQDKQAIEAGEEGEGGEEEEESPAGPQRRQVGGAKPAAKKAQPERPSVRTTGEDIEPEDLRPLSSLDKDVPFEDQWTGNRAKPDADFVTDGSMMIPKDKIIDQPLAKEMEEGTYRSVENSVLKPMYDRAVANATKELQELGYATVKLAAKSPGLPAPEPYPYAYYTDEDGKVYILDPDFVNLLQKATGGDTFYATPEGDRVILKREGEPTALLMAVKPDRMPIPTLETIRQKVGEFLRSETGTQTVGQAAREMAERLSDPEMRKTLASLGLVKFVREDVIPVARDVARGISQARGDIRKLLAPAARGPQAMEAALTIRQRAAELAQATDRAEAALSVARRYFASLPVEENLEFIDRMENGQAQRDSSLDLLAKVLRETLDDRRDQVRDLGTGKLENYYENYFPHIWKKSADAERVFKEWFAKRPMEGSKSFLKQRKLPTVKDGTDAGLELESNNPVDLVLMKLREMDKYIFAHRALNDMKESGLLKFVRATERAPEGYQKIDDKVATVYEGKTEQGSLAIRGQYYAPEPAATVINNYLSPGLRRFGGFRAYVGLANSLNMFQLGWSAYHLGFTSFDSAVSRVALGVMQIAHGKPLEGLATAASFPAAPFRGIVQGDKMLKEWYRPGTQGGEIATLVDAMVTAGGRARMDRFYATQITKAMMDAFRKGNIWGGILRVPFAATEQASRPILEWIVPRQKMAVFADLAREILEQAGPDATPADVREALSKAWDSVDNRMGQLVYDNLFWNKAFKDLLMASVRSVGWNVGTIREIVGGGKDALEAAQNLGSGKKAELTSRMAYIIGLVFVSGLIGGMLHYLNTGETPHETKDWFFPRRGERSTPGWNKRMVLPSYVKDIVHWAHDPAGVIRGKVHPMLSLIMEMLTNRDYFDKPIRNQDDPLVKQMWDSAKHAVETAEPLAMRPLTAPQKTRKQETPAEKILPFIGITEAPKYIKQEGNAKAVHRYRR